MPNLSTDLNNLFEVKEPKNHIDLMGIELEGAWDKLTLEGKRCCKEDSSVEIDGNEGSCSCCSGDCECDYHDETDYCRDGNCSCDEFHRDSHDCERHGDYNWIGELASPTFDSYKKMMDWTDKNYPDKSNSSCGIHVHISFLNLMDYSNLMEQKFYRFFEEKMLLFGKLNGLKENSQFYRRLSGNNTYCHKTYTPDLNAHGNGDRYQQLNMAFSSHGTLEIRVLPCFQEKKFALRAIEFIYIMLNQYLNNCKAIKSRRFKKLRLKEKIEVTI